MRIAGFLIFGMLLSVWLFADDVIAVDIVRNGQAVAVILLPDNPYPVESYAAKELQYHIRQSTGASLDILPESQQVYSKDPTIVIGHCQRTRRAGILIDKLPPAGYIVKTVGNTLFLAGHDNDRAVGNISQCTWHGSLFAVYEFLERELEVKWLWPGELGELIPERKDIRVDFLDIRGQPRFWETAWIVPSLSRRAEYGWASTTARDKFLHDQDTWLLRHRFSSTKSLAYGHAFGDYWKRFGRTHPEYFNLLPNGKREPLPGDKNGSNITLCVSQPELWKQIIKDWANNPLRDPGHIPYRPFVNACENDSPALCTCEACRAWDAPDEQFETSRYWHDGIIPTVKLRFRTVDLGLSGDGSPWTGIIIPNNAPSLSDRYAKFYLALQKEAQKIDAQAVIFGYAYANYWQAPKHTKLNERIIISFVPPLWFPYTEEMSEDFRKNWDGWATTGARLVLRPNLTHAGHNLPIFYARRLASDFAYASQHGMIGSRWDSLLGSWGTQGPTLYVLGRMHQHPDWPVEKMLDEYYNAFGPAKAAVKKYFQFWEKVSEHVTTEDICRYNIEEGGGGFKDYVLIADRIFTPELMSRGEELLEKALRSAEEDTLARKRVRFLEKGLKNAILTLNTLRAFKNYRRTKSPQDLQAYKQAMQQMMYYREKIEMDEVADMGYLAYREKRGAKWDHYIFRDHTDH